MEAAAIKFDAKDFEFLQKNIVPYYLIFSKVLCGLTVISYPILIYAFWKKTLKMSNVFRCLATYTHTFGVLFCLTLLIFQPIYIPQLYVVYSSGPTANLDGKYTFASICVIVICITHSCHGLCLSVFYCYHMSLRKCNAWFSRPKKLVFTVVFSYAVVLSVCVGHCFTLPNNDETIARLSKDYGIIADLAKTQPSLIAFSTTKNTNLHIFMIYTVIIITVFLCFCLFLFLNYMKYRSQQNQDLSVEILKTIQILRLNYRIRVLLAIFIQVFPGFLFFFFIFVKPFVEAAFVCLTLLTAYPFLDIIVEILSIKVYRNKLLSVFKNRKKFSVAFTNIVLPSKSSRGSLFE